jgi:hypothetical protein
MAHESIPAGPDGDPVRSTRSPSGFARAGLCPEAGRAANLGCSHTMARYVLRDAIMQVPGEGDGAVVAALHELEQTISLLDHRRYEAESRRASAKLAGADDAPGEREIAILIAEHRACVMRAGELRDDVLRRIDDALGAARADTPPQASRTGVQIPTVKAVEGKPKTVQRVGRNSEAYSAELICGPAHMLTQLRVTP